MDVSDRRMQVQLTPEAKIATDFFFIGAIFVFVGFVSALSASAWGAVLLWPPRLQKQQQAHRHHRHAGDCLLYTSRCV